MAYVYSTLTASQAYTSWNDSGNGLPTIERQVNIQGGANLSIKNIHTPLGVATRVTEDELAWLQTQYAFMQHVKAGHITFDEKGDGTPSEADRRAEKHMTEKDKSAQKTPKDFERDPDPTKRAKGKKLI